MVGKGRLELPRFAAHDPKSCSSTNFDTPPLALKDGSKPREQAGGPSPYMSNHTTGRAATSLVFRLHCRHANEVFRRQDEFGYPVCNSQIHRPMATRRASNATTSATMAIKEGSGTSGSSGIALGTLNALRSGRPRNALLTRLTDVSLGPCTHRADLSLPAARVRLGDPPGPGRLSGPGPQGRPGALYHPALPVLPAALQGLEGQRGPAPLSGLGSSGSRSW